MSNKAGPRPLIIGHRGASAVAPENTLAAFIRSIQDRADGFEFDVRLSRDRIPVVIHDGSLERTSGKSQLVSNLTGAELGRIDVGSWFNRKFPDRSSIEYVNETVPTLQQTFELVANSDQLLYLEMKCENDEASRLAGAVVNLIDEYEMCEQVVVESFDLPAIVIVKQLNSRIRTAALFEPKLKRPMSLVRKFRNVDLALAARANEFAPHHSLTGKRVIDKARGAGLSIVVWTVDDANWIKKARALGVDAIITNDPARLVAKRTELASV